MCVNFSANRCCRLGFLLTRPLLPYSLPTQDPPTEIKLCRQTPQGFPEDILFLGENEFIDFSASEEREVQLVVQGREPGRAGRGPAARGRVGGQQPTAQWAPRSSLLPVWTKPHRHCGVTVGFPFHCQAHIPGPPNEVQAPGGALKGLSLWPKIHFQLYSHPVSATCLERGRSSIHSFGRCEGRIPSY